MREGLTLLHDICVLNPLTAAVKLIRFALLAGPSPAPPADGTGPTWPCVQRKQPKLSPGQIWFGPTPEASTARLAREPRITGLADALIQRRPPIEQAESGLGRAIAPHLTPADG